MTDPLVLERIAARKWFTLPTSDHLPPELNNADRRDLEITNLRDAFQQQGRRFTLLAELSRRLVATLDPAVVLYQVVEAACELTGARYGALGVFDQDGRIQQFITHGIGDEERARIGDLPQGLGVLGWLQEVQEPIRLGDLGQHPRSVGFPANHPPMKTFLGMPIRHEGAALGNIYLTEKAGGSEFTPEDQELLLLLAGQAALAIHNARLHQAVEAERVRLRTLVDTSPAGVMLVDAVTRKVLLLNREAERIFGVPPGDGRIEDYLAQVAATRADGSFVEVEDRPLMRALDRGERVVAEELHFASMEGVKVPTLVNATPVYGPEGTITAALSVIQDISTIEELQRLRNEFLGMVSHELKTPLTAIKGSAAMAIGARRPLSGDESAELFRIIDEQADRLRDLVDNLLDMTRIEAGTLSVSTAPTDLREVFAQSVKDVSRMYPDREVRLQAPEELAPADADGRRIQQVLGNLLSNASKYSPANSPIDVAIDQDVHHLTVHVRDYGRGIAAEELHRLFLKFSQLPDEQGRRGTGHGLGLAICKGIVEAHGGRIWAESPGLGRGSTFSFTLPLAREAARASQADVSQRSAHIGRVGRPGERTRIVVLDDDIQVLRYVERALDGAGYRPIPASDPRELIGLVESEEPDLVLLDLNLPGTDGFELLGRIREFTGVPVIFLTAVSDSELTVKALRAGADDYISKPFAPTELIARIEASLRRRVMADQTEVRAPFELDQLTVDFAQRRVSVAGQPVTLSATEYKLLYELAISAGRVLTHEQLLKRVWGQEYSGEHELVRSFIRNLRRKLGDDARNPRYIFTEPQVGYRMPARAG